VMYAEIGGVSSNVHRTPSSSAPAGPLGLALETASHPEGTRTENRNRALTSGWSKHGNTRWASNGSESVWTYTRPSVGSRKRFTPLPDLEYSPSVTSRTSLLWARPSSRMRVPSWALASPGFPLMVSSTRRAEAQSRNVEAPGSSHSKRTVVSARNLSSRVRSSDTSCSTLETRAARPLASSRVRLLCMFA
jgi:hypothetical protein